MSNLKALGLAFAAMLVIAGLTAVSASASDPALYECAKAPKIEKKFSGHYSNKKCTPESFVAAGGQKYEFQEWKKEPAKIKAFKGKGAGANLEIQGAGGITCKKSSDTGKFTGPKTASDINVTFTGCEFLGFQCASAGAKAGEVKTNPLKAEIGYVNKAKHEVGVDLSAEKGLYEAELTCSTIHLRVSGAVIGTATPVNTFSKTATLTFNQSAGFQEVEHFESGIKQTLFTEVAFEEEPFSEESGAQSGEETEVTNKGEELELKA